MSPAAVTRPRRVVVESPFAAPTPEGRDANDAYLLRCLKDCLSRGEAPFASHALYPQVLDDNLPEERSLGMAAGFAWVDVAEATVVYVDRGVSKGMIQGMLRAMARGIPVEVRSLEAAPEGA